jgi:hypothetical protein
MIKVNTLLYVGNDIFRLTAEGTTSWQLINSAHLVNIVDMESYTMVDAPASLWIDAIQELEWQWITASQWGYKIAG